MVARVEQQPAKVAHSIAEVELLLGVSHVTVYKEINCGRLRTFCIGRRRLVSDEALS